MSSLATSVLLIPLQATRRVRSAKRFGSKLMMRSIGSINGSAVLQPDSVELSVLSPGVFLQVTVTMRTREACEEEGSL